MNYKLISLLSLFFCHSGVASDFKNNIAKISPDINVQKASVAIYDSYLNFFQQPSSKKDEDLYKNFINSNLCLLSFISMEEYPKLGFIMMNAKEDASSTKNFESRNKDFENLNSKMPKIDPSNFEKEKYRSLCNFKLDQKSLESLNLKDKDENKIINEDYEALMKAKQTGHPDLKKVILESENYLAEMVNTSSDSSKSIGKNDVYKKLLFITFSKLFSVQDTFIQARVESSLIGECAKDIYEKYCANNQLYKDIPGIGFRKRACFNDNETKIDAKCSYKKF